MLAGLPSGSAHACVTSPPYWGLRDYGVAGQVGMEKTPDEYVAALVGVMRQVRRVLREDGVLWLNLGDSYAGAGDSNHAGTRGARRADGGKSWHTYGSGLPNQSLAGTPWRVALALQADGWLLRGAHGRRVSGARPTCACGAGVVPGTVLDPFLGAGTVAGVAEALGRRWVGCELSEKYADLVPARISEVAAYYGRQKTRRRGVPAGQGTLF